MGGGGNLEPPETSGKALDVARPFKLWYPQAGVLGETSGRVQQHGNHFGNWL